MSQMGQRVESNLDVDVGTVHDAAIAQRPTSMALRLSSMATLAMARIVLNWAITTAGLVIAI